MGFLKSLGSGIVNVVKTAVVAPIETITIDPLKKAAEEAAQFAAENPELTQLAITAGAASLGIPPGATALLGSGGEQQFDSSGQALFIPAGGGAPRAVPKKAVASSSPLRNDNIEKEDFFEKNKTPIFIGGGLLLAIMAFSVLNKGGK